MSYSNPMHHAPGARAPAARAFTLPDGRRAADAPANWPFGLEAVRPRKARELAAARAFLASRPAAPF